MIADPLYFVRFSAEPRRVTSSSERNLARVRASLAGAPALAAVFEAVFAPLAARDDLAVLASGSLANGTMDRWSDLDLEVVIAPRVDAAEVRDAVRHALDGAAKPLSRFAADHLGLADLMVSFMERDGRVIKADVWVMRQDGLAMVPGAVVLHDPSGLAASRPAPFERPPADLDDLYKKFCGWMWFTHVKLARGHFLEALETVEFMRAYALLPALHRVENLPRENYRLLETRLAPERLQWLYRTYPAGVDRDEIYRAMFELAALFSDLHRALGRTDQCVERMRALIEEDRNA